VTRSGVGEPVALADNASTVRSVHLLPARHSDVCGHRVGGRPLLPFSALAGLLLHTVAPNGLTGFAVRRPVSVADAVELQIGARADGALSLHLRTDDDWAGCVTADRAEKTVVPPMFPGLERLRAGEPVAGEKFYTRATAAGVDYEAPLRVLREIWLGETEAVADIAVDRPFGDSLGADWTGLEAAVQLAAALLDPAPGAAYLPASMAALRQIGVGQAHSVYVRRDNDSTSSEVDFRATVLDSAGSVLTEIVGLRFVSLDDRATDNPRDWLHALDWQPDSARPARTLPSGAWVVLADRGGVAERVRALLPDVDVRVVSSALDLGMDRIAGVVDLTALDTSADVVDAVHQSCRRAADLADLLERQRDPAELWLVTAGAQATGSDHEIRPTGAAVWGFGRALSQERTGLRTVLLDLDPAAAPARLAEQLADAVSVAPPGESAIRNGQRLVPQLKPFTVAAKTSRPVLRADAAYLVTGGFGGIGLAVADWLGQCGARRILLAGRTALPPRSAWHGLDPDSRDGLRTKAILRLEAAGVTVEPVVLDVGDRAAVAEFVGTYQREHRPPVRGVFHLAAVLADELTTGLTDAGLATVLGPKVGGAVHLDEFFPDVDQFVLFSSAAALIPLPGQASYAAANAFLGALAARRGGLAVHWSVWDGLGFADSQGGRSVADFLRAAGQAPLPADGALTALGLLLAGGVTEAAVLRGDGSDVDSVDGPTDSEILRQFRETSAPAHHELFEGWLAEVIGRITRMAPDSIDPTRPFPELGMDSMMAVELRNALERDLGFRLSATVAFSYPSIGALAGFLATEVAGREAPVSLDELTDDLDDELAAVLLAAAGLDDPDFS
jgi:acyl carrier protein